jgi:magnesium chelatase subunit D
MRASSASTAKEMGFGEGAALPEPYEGLPLPALVGMEPAVQALLLLAVEPRLGGLVFAAAAGAGKSSLARGFRALLGEHTPFVELPLGADEDGLLGGLDIEATMRAGRRVARPGALARADGGVVYVDQLNLLPDGTANLLLGVLDAGEVRVEREGLSMRAPARFRLLGSYDPDEGNPRRHLLDRVGLLLTLPRADGERERVEIVRRNNVWGTLSPTAPDWQDELDLLRGLVLAAAEQLPAVRIGDEQVRQLVAMAAACGVEGHRGDIFAIRAACAAAALGLRDEVEHEDLELAVRLVILPRATRIPQLAEPPPEQPQQQQPEQQQRDAEPPDDATHNSELNTQNFPEEQVLSALATELPAELDELPFRAQRRGRSGSRGSVAGKRGRHIRSVPGDPRRARLDVPATLRAAAPWQRLRNAAGGTLNAEQLAGAMQPWFENDITAREQTFSVQRSAFSVQLRADDLRVKQYRSKAGALFLFAVDASGSMALHRMRQAKGAVHALLQKAYVHRDRVALLAFRGDGAELLLPPSQSVELARRALDLLPTGGGTPLGAALLATLEVARQARSRGIMQTVLVLLTDGRANVALRGGREGVNDELRTLAASVAEAGISAIVVDTQRSYLSRGEARTLAEHLRGQYIYLPNAKGEQIAELAMESIGD